MQEVYINQIAKFLPNQAVSNEMIEDILGLVNEKPSRAKAIVLRNNKILSRYYALDAQGKKTHDNASMTMEAVNMVLAQAQLSLEAVDLLSCGTSTPDQLLPSHASMVHGLLKARPMEINAASGICTAGMNALKYAFLSVCSGNAQNAISTGSERVSSWLRAEKYNNESKYLQELERNPMIGFDKDFLRWMLSDGAGAMLLSSAPNPTGISLKIKWIDGISFANELETCMYAGAVKKDGELLSWSDLNPEEWLRESVFSIKQDIKLLETNIIKKGVQSTQQILAKRNLDPTHIDHYLPHISSYVFMEKLHKAFEEAHISIPLEKWFINLEKVGNIGSASIYLQLEELFHSERLKKGQKILLSVPESGRFNYVYALLEVA